MDAMKLMGVDVGFSTKRRTTGIACLDENRLFLARVGTEWARREAVIPHGFHPSMIALDGPLLPQGASESMRRPCESLFVRAPFHNRCKPGLSHSGSGLALRRATADACIQFARKLSETASSGNACVRRDGSIVEAFPNAFLGVLTPDPDLLAAPKFKRGRRFDWLYGLIVVSGILESRLSPVMHMPADVWQRLKSESDHELRAALICLLTAELAKTGVAEIVGEDTGGWFWLPPLQLWEPWAIAGLRRASAGFPWAMHA
jgi:hypothetical protein